MDDLIPENSYNLPEDILEYINSSLNVEAEDEDLGHILLEHIKECGGFRFLADDLKKEIIKFSKSLPEKEEAVFRLYFGITYDDENISMKHYLEQNFTVEQIEIIKARAIREQKKRFKDDDHE